MNCMFCNEETKVVDSRPSEDNKSIRRRRECVKCSKRFTTYEKVETMPIMVVKKDSLREPFDRDKLLDGIIKACNKRPISAGQIEKTVENIENTLFNSFKKEVTSYEIGELLMQELKKLDEIAYIRFASVYKQFKDVNTFIEELTKILEEKNRL